MLIAIAGLKNSGKNEAASMLQYCLNTPKFMHSYTMYKLFGSIVPKTKWQITSFAKPLKEMLAILLNVPVKSFEDRTFKEHYIIDFDYLRVFRKLDRDVEEKSCLSDNAFQKLCKTDNAFALNYDLSVRQMMQYFGTNIMRKYFGDNLWVNATLNSNKNMIISDLRFHVEMKSIKRYNGKVIYIQRPGCLPGNHASEKEVMEMYQNGEFDHIIKNDGSLEDLFNKIKRMVCNF